MRASRILDQWCEACLHSVANQIDVALDPEFLHRHILLRADRLLAPLQAVRDLSDSVQPDGRRRGLRIS